MRENMDSKALALRCRELADDKKAENLVILDLRKLPGVTDYMVIGSGTSEPHLRAVVEEVELKLKRDEGLCPLAVDGTWHSGWVVLDYVDVMVHVMKPDVREHYDLEGLWNDAPRVRVTARKAAVKKVPAKKATPRATKKKAA